MRNLTILLLLSLSFGTVTDIDGNTYETIQIGEELWMAENLKVTHYNNGDEIPHIASDTEWKQHGDGAYCYNQLLNDQELYGNIYNWYAVDDSRELCAEGWHVPSMNEWEILFNHLGGSNVAGGKMKECTEDICPESNYWNSPNTGATNESGFTARPGGWRAGNHGGFDNITGRNTYFWSSIANTGFALTSNGAHISTASNHLLDHGFSVRCLADEITQGCTDPYAQNYDEISNVDDGSCEYPDNGDYSLKFDGVDDYISIVDSPSLTIIGDITMAAWIYNNDQTDNYATIVNKRVNDYWPWNLSISHIDGGTGEEKNKIYSGRRNPPAIADYKFSSDQLSMNQWNFIVTTISNDTITFYLNGQDAGYIASNGNVFDIPAINQLTDILVGCAASSYECLSGRIDNLFLFDRALNNDEIQNLMINEIIENEPNLAAHYKFNAGTGNTLYDHSGNQNHGAINGASWVCNNMDLCGVCGGDNSSCPTVTDIDDNVYGTVQIGNQLWMRQNLKTTHYNDGSEIPTGYSQLEWSSLSTGAYSVYPADSSITCENNCADVYGNLYNWYSVEDDRDICPEGWHVPSDNEYTILTDYLGGMTVAGGKMKEEGLDHWNSPNTGATNESGFTALPAGYRNNGPNLMYQFIETVGFYWSATNNSSDQSWMIELSHDDSEVSRHSGMNSHGFSIRCLGNGIEGCTDESACNYEQFAILDDGSCEYNSGTWHVSVDGDDSNCGSAGYPLSSIQVAIDAASDGDSVLVSAGTYYENINFNGKNIAVIGQNRETTIIDGEQNGSVVTLSNVNNGEITNFTITNGSGSGEDNYIRGGGLYIQSSYVLLSNLIIKENTPNHQGGGIWAFDNSDLIINNCIIKNNTTVESEGSGIGLYGHTIATLNNTVIHDNYSEGTYSGSEHGIGIYCSEYTDLTINNSIVYNNNSGDSAIGGVSCGASTIIKIVNSIIRSNSDSNIEGINCQELDITYSNIEGGYEGNGNIDADPLFCDAENGNFTVRSDSPVLDTGQDGTNMGAYGVGCDPIIGCTDNYASNYIGEVDISDNSACEYPDNGDYSLKFDGDDDYVLTPDLLVAYQYTIEANIFLSTQTSGTDFHNILSNGINNADINFGADNNNPDGFIPRVSGRVTSDTTLNRNQWYHLALVKDTNNYLFYVNGSLVKEEDIANNYGDIYSVIGAWRYNGNLGVREVWEGMLDEIRIWSYARTQSEIINSIDIVELSEYDGLLAYWKFNSGSGEILYDHSGNQNHGTINGATWYMEGCTNPLADNYNPDATEDDGSCTGACVGSGYSLSFDGMEDWVNIPHQSQYNNLNDFSIGIWFKTAQNDFGHLVINEEYPANPSNFWQFNINHSEVGADGNILFYFYNGIATPFNMTEYNTNSFNDNIWHFAVATRYAADGKIRVYVDGELNKEYFMGSGTLIIDSNIQLGEGVINGREFGGLLDELSIWDRALSQNEIQNYMTTPPANSESGLLGYWNFNEGTGATLTDQTANGNHGTLMNMDESSWVLNNNTCGCSTDSDACNYDADGDFDNQICLYDDCAGVCGGDAWADNCGECYGDNSTCDIQSTEMAAYYFSSVSLDGQTPVEIVARNEESGMVVGSASYGNVGNGITEVLVYGEMVADYVVNTDGLMSFGATPQFYVDGHKAHYVASDGSILQEIPPFYPLEFSIDLSLDLQTDCNGDMGGSAVISGTCGDCWGGNTGKEEDYMDTDVDENGNPDPDGVCNDGAANGDADNCPNIANSDQADCDADTEGDACDTDDDNDGALDENDSDDCNANVCNDDDGDSCDECSSGSYDSANDGADCDGDGLCDEGDSDDDNDGALDENDSDDCNVNVCSDNDGDTCDDCSSGSYDSANDGLDNDGDGWCDAGDEWPDCSNDPIDANPYDECGICHGEGYIDDCGTCDDNYFNDCDDLDIVLDNNSNLISFPALPRDGDCSVENIFDSLGDNLIGVFSEGAAFVKWNGFMIGSLTEIYQDEGYWVLIIDVPDTLFIYDAVSVSYDDLDDFCQPCDNCNSGEVVYEMHYGNNLISYPFQDPQSIGDALGDNAAYVYGIIGESIAAMNIENDWVGSLTSFEGGSGYWLIATDDFEFTFSGHGSLARVEEQAEVRQVPELYSYLQSSKQAFYFIESATIHGKPLNGDDIIIAYNGENVVGSRYWNGQYTDVPAMGTDEYGNTDRYCQSGDQISFKVLDASSNELIDMETDIETAWYDLSISLINLTEVLPDAFSLDRAYPNPFNPVTTLRFALPIETQVSIQIYNLQGRQVISLINGNMGAGYHSVVWNADSHSSGMYFVKMIAGEYVNTQKLMLVK